MKSNLHKLIKESVRSVLLEYAGINNEVREFGLVLGRKIPSLFKNSRKQYVPYKNKYYFMASINMDWYDYVKEIRIYASIAFIESYAFYDTKTRSLNIFTTLSPRRKGELLEDDFSEIIVHELEHALQHTKGGQNAIMRSGITDDEYNNSYDNRNSNYMQLSDLIYVMDLAEIDAYSQNVAYELLKKNSVDLNDSTTYRTYISYIHFFNDICRDFSEKEIYDELQASNVKWTFKKFVNYVERGIRFFNKKMRHVAYYVSTHQY